MSFIRKSRGWMSLALISLGGVFFFPVWQIKLHAPQFPEGLSMNIWINKISGSSESILQNVNMLNHYIGMKPIHPESIPELTYFPWVIAGMLILGLITLWYSHGKLYLLWTFILGVLGALGLYDFYLWLYDYGHDLDPTAPITIEGGSFMPPFFGSREMANFMVTSYPDWGSLTVGLAFLFGFLAYFTCKIN